METLPTEVAQYAQAALAPALTATVYAAVWAIKTAAFVPRRQLARIAGLLGFAIGIGFGLAPYAGAFALSSSAIAGGIIGLAASGLREATRKS